MAYDRYDRGDDRDERWRWSGERHDRERSHRGRDERGFFERAGEEISAWFGGGDDDRHRGEHRGGGRERFDHRDRERGYDPERANWMRERGSEHRDHPRHRQMDEPRGWGADREHRSSESDFWSRHDRDRWNDRSDDSGYRPMAGDYGRAGERRHEHRPEEGRSGFRRDERRPAMSQSGQPRSLNRSDSDFDRDEYRRTSFAGSAARSSHDDPHYDEMRRRHMEEFDRDYGEYRSEQGSRFENDFGGWRERRQSKRSILRDIREHMEVVGSDGKHVGTIDRVAGDRLILTRSDPEAGGVHHSLSCTDVDCVDGNRVILDLSAERARDRWRDESRGRALFEREDQGRAGPHVLDRSFSGTYR